MDQKQIESWRKVRAKGRRYYVLFYGGLIWGAPSGLLMSVGESIFELIWGHVSFSSVVVSLLVRFPFYVAVFFFSGCVLGSLMWNRYEREYAASVESSGDLTSATQQIVGRERSQRACRP
jgi:hypothetical protein